MGRLTVGYGPYSEFAILPDLRNALAQRFPNLELRFQSRSPEEQVSMIRSESLDASFFLW